MAAAVARPALVAAQQADPPFGGRTFPADAPAVRVGVTGSGSDLLLLAWSAADLEREIAAGTRVMGGLGVTPGTPVANTLPGALATPGALLLGDVHEAIGALDVPLGVPESDAAARAAWELVDRVRCRVLVLAPETGARFLAAAPAADRSWWTHLVWLVRDGATAVPAAPAGFGGAVRRWLAVPEVASFAAGTCERDRFHVDAALEASVEGGTLVLASPSLRYATGLAARVATGCACGRPGATLVF